MFITSSQSPRHCVPFTIIQKKRKVANTHFGEAGTRERSENKTPSVKYEINKRCHEINNMN